MALAGRQGGRVTRAQLLRCGLSEDQVGRLLRSGWLFWICDGVYALGHRAETLETPLIEALLRAGSGAALSHVTAAWWWGLLRFPGKLIHVSAPGRRRSGNGVQIHHRERSSAPGTGGFR